MSEIRFFCAGHPAPGGSKTGFAIKKGGVYTGRVAIIDAGGQRQIKRPKSHYRSDGIQLKPSAPSCHVIRPDCLKLARSTEDAMTGKVYVDDAQIVKETIEKAYSDRPGCMIVVREANA